MIHASIRTLVVLISLYFSTLGQAIEPLLVGNIHTSSVKHILFDPENSKRFLVFVDNAWVLVEMQGNSLEEIARGAEGVCLASIPWENSSFRYGRHYFTQPNQREINCWNFNTSPPQVEKTFLVPGTPTRIVSITTNEKQDRLAAVCEDGGIVIWDRGSGLLLARKYLPEGAFINAIYKSNNILCAATQNGEILKILPTKFTMKDPYLIDNYAIRSLDYKSDRDLLLITTSKGVYSSTADNEYRKFVLVKNDGSLIHNTAFSPFDKRTFCVSYEDGIMELRCDDTLLGSGLKTCRDDNGVLIDYRWSSGGEFLYCVKNGAFYYFLRPSFTKERTIPHQGVTAAAFSRDKLFLATGDSNGSIKIWRVTDLIYGVAPVGVRAPSPERSTDPNTETLKPETPQPISNTPDVKVYGGDDALGLLQEYGITTQAATALVVLVRKSKL